MSYSLLDLTGSTRTPAKQDKVTAIDGESVAFYLVEIEPFGHTQRFQPKLISPSLIAITPFVSLDENGVASYGTPYEVKADVHWIKTQRYDPKLGADTLVSIGHLNVLHAPTTQRRKLLSLHYLDKVEGLTFSGQWAVEFVTVSYPDADGRGNYGTPAEDFRPITVELVEAQAGHTTADGLRLQQGEAMVKVSRDQLSRAEIDSLDNYFSLSLNGQPAERYHLNPNAPKGYCVELTHFYHLYLTKGLA